MTTREKYPFGFKKGNMELRVPNIALKTQTFTNEKGVIKKMLVRVPKYCNTSSKPVNMPYKHKRTYKTLHPEPLLTAGYQIHQEFKQIKRGMGLPVYDLYGEEEVPYKFYHNEIVKKPN